MDRWRGFLMGALFSALLATATATALAGPDALIKDLSKSQVKKISTKQADKRIKAAAVSEPFHIVGESGEPAFENGWANVGFSLAEASFYKDPLGVVHLRGAVEVNAAGNSATVFTLPPGYRPANSYEFPIAPLSVGTTGRLTVFPEGKVAAWCMEDTGCSTSIDGASFLAD